MEKIIHILGSDGIGCDVLITEGELTSFRKLAASAAKAGRSISFDEWALDELRRASEDLPPRSEHSPLPSETSQS